MKNETGKCSGVMYWEILSIVLEKDEPVHSKRESRILKCRQWKIVSKNTMVLYGHILKRYVCTHVIEDKSSSPNVYLIISENGGENKGHASLEGRNYTDEWVGG